MAPSPCTAPDTLHLALGTRYSTSRVHANVSSETSVSIPVDVRRFPWIRRLAADYTYNFASVASFFSGDPAQRSAWADAIASSERHARRRSEIAAVVAAQQQRRDAPSAAIEAGR